MTAPERDPLLRADGRPRKRLRAADRRDRIYDAALRVFSERGYEATSMEEIAALSGVARPVLYDHFGSKRELFLSLLERERAGVAQHVVAEARGDDPPETRVRRLIDGFFRYVEMHPATWRTLFQDVVGDPEVLAAQRKIQGEANMMVASRLLQEGGPLETVKEPGTRVVVLAELWGWALKGLARWWYEHPEVDRSELVDAAMAALWGGLTKLVASEPARSSRRAAKASSSGR